VASLSAVSVITAGITIRELRELGASGGTSTSFGRVSIAVGKNHLIALTEPRPTITTISAPTAILPHCMTSHPCWI